MGGSRISLVCFAEAIRQYDKEQTGEWQAQSRFET